MEEIFALDEMDLREVDAAWTMDDLLDQDGIFFFKDIVTPLYLSPEKVIKRAKTLGDSAWAVMGMRKVWNHWMVRMTVFSVYFREHLQTEVRRVQASWDSNDLLRQKGIFLLSQVCRLLPFSTQQLRHQAKQNPRAEEEFGIWKDVTLNRYVVDMEPFSQWIRALWSGEFRRTPRDDNSKESRK